jgi:Protein of unknown function (DUF1091)
MKFLVLTAVFGFIHIIIVRLIREQSNLNYLTNFSLLPLQAAQIYLYSSKITTNPKLIENASFSVFNGSDGVSRLNVSVFLKVDLARPSTMIECNGKLEGSLRTNEIYRGQIDPCQVQKNWFLSFFIKASAASIKEFSNYRFDCPHKKGLYYASNFPVFDFKKEFPLIAMTQANTSTEFEYTIIYSAKIQKQQKVVKEHVLTAQIYGILVL